MEEQGNNQDSLSRATIPTRDPIESAKTLTTIIYALQAVSIPFSLGTAMLVGVIINYVKLDDVRGSWLESHFRWQIRTFWYGLLWAVLGIMTFLIVVGYFVLVADTIWVIYRIVKGWLRLNDGKEMYPDASSSQRP